MIMKCERVSCVASAGAPWGPNTQDNLSESIINRTLKNFKSFKACWDVRSLAYSFCHETLLSLLISDSVANRFHKDLTPLYPEATDGPIPLRKLAFPLCLAFNSIFRIMGVFSKSMNNHF